MKKIQRAVPQVILDDLAESGLVFDPWPTWLQYFNPHPTPKLLAEIYPKLNFEDRAAVLLFPHHDWDAEGNLIPIDPHDFCRIKNYYKTPDHAAFGKDRRRKYDQAEGTPIIPYIPPNANWPLYFTDDEQPLFIVEGEKKALAMCSRGLYAIAIGGVYNFAPGQYAPPAERVLPLCPIISRAATGRQVIIAHDVDTNYTAMKPEVVKAADRLAHEIIIAGGEPLICYMKRQYPATIKDKWTVEDVLKSISKGTDVGDIINTFIDDCAGYTTAKEIMALQREWIYIAELESFGLINNPQRRFIFGKEPFKTRYNNRAIVYLKDMPIKGRINKSTKVSATGKLGTVYLEHQARSDCQRADMVPGCADTVTEDGVYNLWYGWASPIPDIGTLDMDIIKPFTEALQWLHGPDDWLFMFLWYLYPLAYPEANKINVVPILQSEIQGIGKSRIPELFNKCVYGIGEGRHGVAQQADALDGKSRFEWLPCAMFVLLDDMESLNRKMSVLNTLITSENVHVDIKYVRSFTVKNRANFIITTNYTKPLDFTEEMRRFFVPYCNPEINDPLWMELTRWFTEENGGGKIIRTAQLMREAGIFEAAEFDGQKFSPIMRAPRTDKRTEMEELSMAPAAKWLRDEVVGMARRDVVSIDELENQCMLSLGNRPGIQPMHYSRLAVERALHTTGRSMGFAKQLVRLHTKGAQRAVMYYAVRNCERWENASEREWRDEIKREAVGLKPSVSGR